MKLSYTDIAKIAMGLGANFGVKIPDGLIEIWHETFVEDGYNLEQIKRAAGKIVRTKKDSYGRMPAYAEFIEAIEGDKTQNAELEAQKIIDLVRSEGAYSEPELSPAAKRVIDVRFGGWKNLCGSLEESKLQWFIRDFKEAYLSEITVRDRLMLPDRAEASQIMKQIEVIMTEHE